MWRMMVGFALVVVAMSPALGLAQEAGKTWKPLASGVTSGGLEIAMLEVKATARRDQFGQALARFGSCPPGFAPAGMEGLELVIPGKAVIVHFTIAASQRYAARELSGPPAVIDAGGARHEPHGLYFLPEIDQLKKLATSQQALHCEFPFGVSPESVKALEFEGVRLNVPGPPRD